MSHEKDHFNSLKVKNETLRETTHLTKAPIRTLTLFFWVVVEYLKETIGYLQTHFKLWVTTLSILQNFFILYYTPGIHQPYVQAIEKIVSLAGWWLGLGVLSSIGLGTGLHTFVLYLGPFIAKVAMAAHECNSINFLTYGEDSFICPSDTATMGAAVTIFSILKKVEFEALLWGIGTALGELPPYFVARAAKLAGRKSEELEEFEEELKKVPTTFIERLVTFVKKTAFVLLQKLGFFGIMLFASIPNPLFDLAGIMCGHFNIPFWTFFGATLLGKAFIKANLQTFFIVLMFSKQTLKYTISLIERLLPFLQGTIDDFFESKRAEFHRSATEHHHVENKKNLVSLLWDFFLVAMLLYFVVSIINSSVRGYLERVHSKEEEQYLKKQKKN